MIWDVPHHRGAGFSLYVLRPAGVYPVLADLCAKPGLRPAELTHRLELATAVDAPLIDAREPPEGMSHLLGHLRDAGLIVRNRGTLRGAHTRYSATELGTGLVGALRPVTDWAVADFGFVVAATRVRLGLAPLDGLVPTSRCQERSATNMAINLLAGLWTNVLMVYVDSAGEGGIGPQSLEEAVNGDIKASSGEGRVVRPLPHGTMHATLKALVARGLLLRVEYPPQVRYSLSTHGRGLMDAWWQVADTWGIANDNKLFRIVAKTSGWFQSAEG